MLRRKWLRILTAGSLVASAVAIGGAPSVAAASSITMKLSVSQNPIWPEQDVTFSSVVKPLNGQTPRLILTMQTHWSVKGGQCHPTAFCTVDDRTGNPEWDFPDGIAVDTPISFDTAAPLPGETVTLFNQSDGISCTSCSLSVTMKQPTITLWATRSPTGVVMPGDTLHIKFLGKNDAGFHSLLLVPMLAISGGTEAPTGLPSDWNWTGTRVECACNTTQLETTNSTLVEFDVVVDGAIGSNITFTPDALPGASNSYALKLTKLTVHVGPTPSPTPKPTTRASSAPGTASPASTPTAGSVTPSASPTFVATAAASPLAASAAASATAAPATVAASLSGATSPADPAADPTSAPGGPSGVVLISVLLVAVVGAGAAFLRFKRRGS